MRPILCKIGPVPIFSYGLLIAAGFLVSVHLMRRDAKKAGIDPDRFTDGAFWVLFLGLAGTRLLHIILYYQQYSWTDPLEWIAIWKGGLVFQGAIPPAILFCIYYIRKHHLNFWQCADIACPYIPLGHAFGRLGCFMNGCCYGHVTDLPWGIPFPRVPSDLSLPATGSPVYLDHFGSHSVPHDALWSNPVHPTQLYSVAGLLCLFALILVLRKRWHPFTGFTLPTYFFAYSVFRFFVEFLRGDHNPTHFGGHLTDQQVFCLATAAACALLFAFLYRRAAVKQSGQSQRKGKLSSAK